MRIWVKGKSYDTVYFPFFRTERHKDYAVYGVRWPSGYIEEFVVFNEKEYMIELKDYLTFMLKEFGLEEDIMLTPKAMELKNEVKNLFSIDG